MRISDWSSDVCSSDLNLILADQRIFAVLQHILLLERPRAGVGDGKALVGDRRDDPSLIILLALTQARARAHAVGEAAAVDRPVGGQFGHRRETARAALPHATARGDEIRSEEHTSELQSLMRLSYAVFCLKKNKSTYPLGQKDTTVN